MRGVSGLSPQLTWLRSLDDGDPSQSEGLLVCFPHAGAGAGAYVDWARSTTSDFHVCAVRPPGRSERLHEAPVTALHQIAQAVAAEIAQIDPRHLVLFGHSMGSLTAFETARTLRQAGHATDLIVLSAPAWPPTEMRTEPPRVWDDSQLLELCAELGAEEVGLLAEDPGLRSFILSPLRDDLLVLDRFSIKPEEPLATPSIVLLGDEDPTSEAGLAAAWSTHFRAVTNVRTYPGDHFFIRSALPAVLADLDQDLNRMSRHRPNVEKECL